MTTDINTVVAKKMSGLLISWWNDNTPKGVAAESTYPKPYKELFLYFDPFSRNTIFNYNNKSKHNAS